MVHQDFVTSCKESNYSIILRIVQGKAVESFICSDENKDLFLGDEFIFLKPNEVDNFLGIGLIFDTHRRKSLADSPYPSWIFDDISYEWKAPVCYNDLENLVWIESELNWEKVKSIPKKYIPTIQEA
jgi:hypothetical protein